MEAMRGEGEEEGRRGNGSHERRGRGGRRRRGNGREEKEVG